jgi:molybdenum cofactor cytidylyltransferase
VKFGPVPVADAVGAVAAHTVRAGDLIIRKGVVIQPADSARLLAAGLTEIVCARLEQGDMAENDAAAQLAQALQGPHVRTEAPFTGRANLFAETSGVLVLDTASIDRFNAVDEAITVATLPPLRAVVSGEMIATVKVIPYGLPGASVEAAIKTLQGVAALKLAPFRSLRVAVISTLLPGLKTSVVDKTLKIMGERLEPSLSQVSADIRIAHAPEALAAELKRVAAQNHDLIIVFGASAITDRRDVIPQALVQAGGRVAHLGMPVDPGNLLMIGELAGKPVIGAPGCARSPKENGFDWVLQRLLAEVPVSRAEIQKMGVGGLLMEIIARPQPRAPDHIAHAPPVAAIVLAAGRSTRMGPRNKLRQVVRGSALVRHAVMAALASQADPVIVVTGHESDAVRAVLTGLDVQFVDSPDYVSGLSLSLKAGLAAVPPVAAGALVLLGDMPNVTAEIIDRLIAHLGENLEAKAIVPTVLGQRGNPVLVTRALFNDIAHLTGDAGARKLLDQAGDAVIEVAIDDPAIALDIDTPEALAAYAEK